MTRKLATQTCGLSKTEEEWQARDALLTSAVIILGNPRQSPSLHLTDVTCYFLDYGARLLALYEDGI